VRRSFQNPGRLLLEKTVKEALQIFQNLSLCLLPCKEQALNLLLSGAGDTVFQEEEGQVYFITAKGRVASCTN